jgi:hypothetical protein
MISKEALADYLELWMSEQGFSDLLSDESTKVLDVCHINDLGENHRTVIVCENKLVLLLPPHQECMFLYK